MTRVQRIVLIAYCRLLAYCCLWVPWIGHYDGTKLSLGYGWDSGFHLRVWEDQANRIPSRSSCGWWQRRQRAVPLFL